MPVIAVVGVGPGIGEAVSRHFAAEGFVVALLARTETKLKSIEDAINRDYGKGSAKYYVTDVRVEQEVVSTFTAIKSELGSVNVMVYNAASRRIHPRSILDTTTEEFESFTKINMFGAFWASKCVLPDMLAAGKGTIIFTGATGSLRGSGGLSSFSPGKFGLRALCQTITREFQAKGIHAAHVIIDGPVDTNIIGGVKRRQWTREGETTKLAELDAYLMQPVDLAKIYWYLHTQPRSTWTHELDVRSQMESMFSKL
jgi:NADP-dependent 3-hydroxy acid dehydrogenase YdfG